jgi:hypothetical protein
MAAGVIPPIEARSHHHRRTMIFEPRIYELQRCYPSNGRLNGAERGTQQLRLPRHDPHALERGFLSDSGQEIPVNGGFSQFLMSFTPRPGY